MKSFNKNQYIKPLNKKHKHCFPPTCYKYNTQKLLII